MIDVKQCACAGIAYRNNLNGSRDYKIVGDRRCKLCCGWGFSAQCPQCDGAGVYLSERCGRCGGPGRVPVAEKDVPSTVAELARKFIDGMIAARGGRR